MAHDVEFSIPTQNLGKSDVEFVVRKDEELLGTLQVSNGSIVWFDPKTVYGHKITWSKLAMLIKENATETEAR